LFCARFSACVPASSLSYARGMSSQDRATFTGLLDAESQHRADPVSFSIPRSELRRALAPGSIVKLIFGFGETDARAAERMWVEVLEVDRDGYVGRLDNEPSVISDLMVDDQIRFGPEHIAGLWREMPLAPRPEQFAVVSTRIWRAGARPTRAVRMTPPDDDFSGWFLFADGDPSIPPNDLLGFEPINHHELTSRFRNFDSVEDEPPETEWRWDEDAVEWVHHDAQEP
jgi:uncharacterized protein YegJ (DUF2314 family)